MISGGAGMTINGIWKEAREKSFHLFLYPTGAGCGFCCQPGVGCPDLIPSRDRILREFLRLRQRGKIGLHRPAGVQQCLRIGTVGDPVEVALILHPVG
jgi:hypothetical protein